MKKEKIYIIKKNRFYGVSFMDFEFQLMLNSSIFRIIMVMAFRLQMVLKLQRNER